MHHDLLKYPKNAISTGVRNAALSIAAFGFPTALLALEGAALVNAAGAVAVGSVIAGEAVARKFDYRSFNSS